MFINNDAAAFLSDGTHRNFQLVSTITTQRSQDLTGETLRVDADQRSALSDIAHDNRKRGFNSCTVRQPALEPKRLKRSPPGRHSGGDESSKRLCLCSSLH